MLNVVLELVCSWGVWSRNHFWRAWVMDLLELACVISGANFVWLKQEEVWRSTLGVCERRVQWTWRNQSIWSLQGKSKVNVHLERRLDMLEWSAVGRLCECQSVEAGHWILCGARPGARLWAAFGFDGIETTGELGIEDIKVHHQICGIWISKEPCFPELESRWHERFFTVYGRDWSSDKAPGLDVKGFNGDELPNLSV